MIMGYYRSDHAHDPNEAIWQRYHEAAVAGGQPEPAARKLADAALAEHIERWPRDRKVIPLADANANMEQALAELVVRLRDALENRLWAAHQYADHYGRKREAETLKSLAAAVHGLALRNDQGYMAPSFATIDSWHRPLDENDPEIEGQAASVVTDLIEMLDMERMGSPQKKEHIDYAIEKARAAIKRGRR